MHETVEDTESRSKCVVFESHLSVFNPVRSSAVIAADTGRRDFVEPVGSVGKLHLDVEFDSVRCISDMMRCELIGSFPTADELLGVDRSMWQIADELLYANRCKWSSGIVRIASSHSDRKNYN